jgi:hypothetical protein
MSKAQTVQAQNINEKKTRTAKPYPSCPFADSEQFAKSVAEEGAGQPIRRLTLFDRLGKSPDSSTGRNTVTNAGKYGLTKGGYAADQIELGQFGTLIFDENRSARERARARIDSAILSVAPFKILYEKFSGGRIPASEVIRDGLLEQQVDQKLIPELIDIFVVNLREVGLLRIMSGVDRLVSIDAALDEIPASAPKSISAATLSNEGSDVRAAKALITGEHAEFEKTCFFVTPIGDVGSDVRKHADLVMGSILEPVVSQLGLSLVRADSIDKPGVITNQIYEYLYKSRLVIVDLSYHNPNVFYELAVRHFTGKPIVEIIRSSDRIPFDVSQNRTLVMDLTDIYSFVPNMEVYKSKLATMIRTGLDSDSSDNPLFQFIESNKRA